MKKEREEFLTMAESAQNKAVFEEVLQNLHDNTVHGGVSNACIFLSSTQCESDGDKIACSTGVIGHGDSVVELIVNTMSNNKEIADIFMAACTKFALIDTLKGIKKLKEESEKATLN